jgi:hypothetical protein
MIGALEEMAACLVSYVGIVFRRNKEEPNAKAVEVTRYISLLDDRRENRTIEVSRNLKTALAAVQILGGPESISLAEQAALRLWRIEVAGEAGSSAKWTNADVNRFWNESLDLRNRYIDAIRREIGTRTDDFRAGLDSSSGHQE